MKKILLFTCALFASVILLAQCVPVMPPGAYAVYDADTVHKTNGDVVWVCKDVTIEIRGESNVVFIEKGCTVTLSGSMNYVYMKRPGTLTITGADNNPVEYDASINVTDNGTGNMLTSCDTIKFDYTDAPVDPKKHCDVWAGVSEIKNKQSLKLFPNPASNVLNYEIPDDVIMNSVEIFSTSGQKVYSGIVDENKGEIDISALNIGLYLVILNTDKGQYSGRVNVE